MRISYNWLKELCDFDLSARQLSDELSNIGLCVDTYEPVGDDWALEVEVTSNRPDCLSMIGLAREVAAIVGAEVKHPDCDIQETRQPVGEFVALEVLDHELCPHYTARVIRDIRLEPSPDWLQQRLLTCGLRPINNVVDITNYILWETGQPLHAFDLEKLRGPVIKVRAGRPGETITSIDGTKCSLSPEMCVIADDNAAVAVAGVMGGLDSEISGSTSHVLLESARFKPANIRRTARTLGIPTDASYRFERGVDPDAVDKASRRAAQLICRIAGGGLAQGVLDVRSDETVARDVVMRFSRLGKILGIKVPTERIVSIFRALELEILNVSNEVIAVQVPSFRRDIAREIDLIEEVARFHGYDKIAETTSMSVRPVRVRPVERAESAVRDIMVAAGFFEVLTNSLVDNSPLQALSPWEGKDALAIRNPTSREKTQLRRSLMPNLIVARKFNQDRGNRSVDLFELSKVYLPQPDSKQPDERTCLAALSDRKDGLFVLKGLVEAFVAKAGLKGRFRELPAEFELFETVTCLKFLLEDEPVGVMGLLDKRKAEQLDVSGSPALLEVNFDALCACVDFDRAYRPLPAFPPADRDLAIVVNESVLWADVERLIRGAAPANLESIVFLDVYRGRQVRSGSKSMAFSLRFRAPDRTLRGEEVDVAVEEIREALKNEVGAELR